MKPNVVFILVDDLGWKDFGFHGSDIKTPNIDKLAETGARLEEYYVQPKCTPTRAAFTTGRYPFRYGLQTAVIPSGGKYGLATGEWLLPQALKLAGYQTAIVGKWPPSITTLGYSGCWNSTPLSPPFRGNYAWTPRE